MVRNGSYLFVIDLVRIPHQHRYASYEKTEQGYTACWLEAYLYALNTPKDSGLTATILKKIHATAMKFDTTIKGGQYKQTSNSFPIAPYSCTQKGKPVYVTPYSASQKGLEEFLDYWFTNKSSPPLALSISLQKNPISSIGIVKKDFVEIRNGGVSRKASNVESDLQRIMPYFYNLDTETSIDSLPTVKDSDCEKVTSKLLEEIIKEYNTKIKTAATDKEKIKVIVTHLQRIDQLHPFPDGNVRTVYITLNKLLRDNNMSMTLIMNANRFDCCSADELVDMVEQGQIHFQQLLTHTEGPLVLKAPKELHSCLQNITCPKETMPDVDKALVNQFIAIMSQPNTKSTLNVSANKDNFFSDTENPTIKKLLTELKQLPCTVHQLILTQLNSGSVSLALRTACRHASDPLIIKKIVEYKDELKINLSETSSNGNGPIEWLKANTNLTPQDIKDIEPLLTLPSNTAGFKNNQ